MASLEAVQLALPLPLAVCARLAVLEGVALPLCARDGDEVGEGETVALTDGAAVKLLDADGGRELLGEFMTLAMAAGEADALTDAVMLAEGVSEAAGDTA